MLLSLSLFLSWLLFLLQQFVSFTHLLTHHIIYIFFSIKYSLFSSDTQSPARNKEMIDKCGHLIPCTFIICTHINRGETYCTLATDYHTLSCESNKLITIFMSHLIDYTMTVHFLLIKYTRLSSG